jgi:ubiquinone/menaquinone biosynthesis C-methylase UbiE
MGFYSNLIVPWCIELAMSNPVLTQYRQQVLAEVEGEILEIGFGTGLNLPHYPQKVEKITAIDPNPGMKKIVQKRMEKSSITVDNRVLRGENLPMKDESFDSVVSTWTLCSIAKVEQAIAEIYRVLKPGGKFLFIEHGLSNESKIQVWQNRLTPIQKIIADGCHLNRNIQQLVTQKFEQITIEKFYLPQLPKVVGYMYQGIAIK